MEVSRCFFIARCHASEVLELAEEIFHEVALFVEMKIRWPWIFSIRLGRDDDLHPFCRGCRYDEVGIVAFVGDEIFAVRCFDKTRCFADIGDVSRRDMEMDGVTQSVHQSVDLGGKTTARASNTLRLGPPFPPALCWCART